MALVDRFRAWWIARREARHADWDSPALQLCRGYQPHQSPERSGPGRHTCIHCGLEIELYYGEAGELRWRIPSA